MDEDPLNRPLMAEPNTPQSFFARDVVLSRSGRSVAPVQHSIARITRGTDLVPRAAIM